jgi:predicted PurR-regulated permease PerM
MPDNTASRIYPILVFALAAIATGSLAWKVLAPFGAAFAWAVVLAVGFSGPWRLLEARMPRRRSLAAVLMTLAVGLLVVLPAALLAAALVNEAVAVLGRATAALAERKLSGLEDVLAIPAVARVLAWVEIRTGLTQAQLLAKAGEVAAGVSGALAGLSGSVVRGIFDALVAFLVTLFLLFFLFRDGKALVRAVLDLVPLAEERRVAVLGQFRAMLQSIFRGSLLCALVQGATGGIGWAVAGLPSPFLAAAAMAVLSLLPVGGTALVWGPGAVACWAQGRTGMAAFLVVWGVVVVSTLADNVLKPLLIGGSARIPTLVVFLGVFGGLGAFGLLGLFVGPIVLAFGLTLLEILRESTRAADPEPGAPPGR